MECPLCGTACSCSEQATTAKVRETTGYDYENLGTAPQAGPPSQSCNTQGEKESSEWRDQVAERLSRYRARRKPSAPRYPSLLLRFDAQGPFRDADRNTVESSSEPVPTSGSRPGSALDENSRDPLAQAPSKEALQRSRRDQSGKWPSVDSLLPGAHPGAKIIEFPRAWAAPTVPLDELAEPVVDRPRILEAPELAPPPPALGGITIEAAERVEVEKRPGIDIPLQSAPLGRRILAAAIDALLIGAASAFFGFIFWKIVGVRPPFYQVAGLAAGLTCSFWAVYQYLLIVHSASTPGLRLARLELARFDGNRPCLRTRRWRVLASFLSAASLGMGYAWVLLDEDSLCWHDRITHTYLAPRSFTGSINRSPGA